MAKVNYVIAAWTGNRRKGNDKYRYDRSFYLKKHLRLLEKYMHQLSQITIVAPHNPKEPVDVREYIEGLDGKKVGGVPVVVLRRENRGHSYGSYSYVYGLYRKKFDYYIFIEDDYAFVQDAFDQKMIKLFDSKKNCGYLCGLVTKFGDTDRNHAAISNGITSKEILEKIWEQKGELPSSKFTTTYHCQSQLQFSWAFLDAGFELYDFTDQYGVTFNNIGEKVQYGTSDHMMIALQFPMYEELN